jgi:anti-anti-sigma factor
MNDRDGITVVSLGGELEIGRKEEIRKALAEARDAESVLVDLSAVTYADSIALTELLRFCAGAQQDERRVALVIVTPQFARLVQYAGLSSAFTIFDNVPEARKYLETRAPQ